MPKYWFSLLALLAGFVSRPQVAPPQGYGPALKPGYVRTTDVLAPVQDPLASATLPPGGMRQRADYLDGLGRPLQTVTRQASRAGAAAATDLVTPVVYDQQGRQTYQYLPYASPGSDGSFKTDPFGQQAAFYDQHYKSDGGFYYGRTTYEPSPLGRVRETYAPGRSWAGSGSQPLAADRHGIETAYLASDPTDRVQIWKVSGQGTVYSSGEYAPGQLYKNVTTDEDKKKVVEYRDKEGRTVLKKVQASPKPSGSHQGWLCTYYVYDELGRLVLVIQPRAVEELARPEVNWNLSPVLLSEQCFAYSYDARGRLLTKRVPGAGETQMVYDARDRLVMSQDQNLRSSHQWLYTRYDDLNRPVATGLLSDENHSGDLLYHSRQASGSTTYPDLAGYPSTELTRTFYDSYAWLKDYDTPFSEERSGSHDGYLLSPSATSFPYPRRVEQSRAVRALVTGSRTRVLGEEDQYLYTVSYYDDRARVIQTRSTNISGGLDMVTTQYSHGGMVLVQVASVQKGGTNPQEHTLVTETGYDDLWRVETISRTVTGTLAGAETVTMPRQAVLRQEYDQLGRLKYKTLGRSSATGDGLEKLSYEYNIRGWLTGINSTGLQQDNDAGSSSSSEASWFSMELAYDRGVGAGGNGYLRPQFNGNIAGVAWRSRGDAVDRQYDFDYDGANRLMRGDYRQKGAGAAGEAMDFSVRMGDGVDPRTAYDANGNILSMSQRGWKQGNPTAEVDRLTYSYMNAGLSNRLREVSDEVAAATSQPSADFQDGNPGGSDDYSYDDNGNLTRDGNKGISLITYNHLNLPVQVTVLQPDGQGQKGRVTYTYDALGTKLRKETVDRTLSPEKTTTTLYLPGMVFQDDELQFITGEEGRIRLVKGGDGSCNAEAGVTRYENDYFIKDHLGNIRMVLTDQKASACYMAASMETGAVDQERQVYDIREGQVEDLPGPVREDHPGLGERAYRVQAAGASQKTGLGMALKVMAGDEVRVRAESYYSPEAHQAGGSGSGALILGELLGSFLEAGRPGGIKGALGAEELLTNPALAGPLSAFLNDPARSAPDNLPKAFLNYIAFDEQLRYVEGSFDRVSTEAGSGYKLHDRFAASPVKITTNGYLYIYVSNESEAKVLFDNLQVTHVKGPLLEETHYYPFGLTMEGISSRAMGGVENSKGFNGIDFEHDLDLSIYDADYRELDPQTGRWWQVDPKTEDMENWSPYASSYDNPIRYSDPRGDEPEGPGDPPEKGVLQTLGNGFLKGAEWINSNINPLTPLVELVTGKSYESNFTNSKSRLTSVAELGITLIPGGKAEGVIVNAVEKTLISQGGKEVIKAVDKQFIKTATGTEIKGFTKHGINRTIERGVKPIEIKDALRSPLKTGKIITDKLGRPSQRYIGKSAEVVLNPNSGRIISVNPTSTKKAARLIKQTVE